MKTYFCLIASLLLHSACDTQLQPTSKESFPYLNADTIIVENTVLEDSVPPGMESVPSCYLSVWFAGSICESGQVLSEDNVSYLDAQYGSELPKSYKKLPAPAPMGIDIVCNRDLDGYPAGTSLMGLFKVRGRLGLPYVEWKTNTALSTEIERGNNLWMYPAYGLLMAHPDPGLGLDCTYTVAVMLADGRKLQASIRRDRSKMGD